MRKLIVTLGVVSPIAALGVASSATATAGDAAVGAAATRTVELGDNFFSPRSLTVKKGTIVRFVWGPGGRGTEVEHNVTGVRGNRFATEDTAKRSPYRRRITKSTTIVCTIHSTTMTMKIRVK